MLSSAQVLTNLAEQRTIPVIEIDEF